MYRMSRRRRSEMASRLLTSVIILQSRPLHKNSKTSDPYACQCPPQNLEPQCRSQLRSTASWYTSLDARLARWRRGDQRSYRFPLSRQTESMKSISSLILTHGAAKRSDRKMNRECCSCDPHRRRNCERRCVCFRYCYIYRCGHLHMRCWKTEHNPNP